MAEDLKGLAPYRRIAAKIRTQIEQGHIQPGEPIPSVREIMRAEGVSTATATRVAAVLRAEGYAESIPGIGTIARIPPPAQTTGPDRLQLLRATGSGFRPNERVEILTAGLTEAPRRVADALDIDPGDEVIQRQRRYLDDLGVVTVSTSWLPRELAGPAPELLTVEPLPKMTFGLIEDRTGRRASRRRDTIAIRPVPHDIAPLLEVEEGHLALTMVNRYWDQNGDLTEYAEDFLGRERELSADYDLT
ncbi:GntR family transcriptional regulator [Nonomuraea sp. NPDC049419]|uniref:GntR family transcriptional regulator n=1 Tax=Nonomuraea sp. NPDC049419 TaxID=3155772 RepID=UPI0034257E6F